MYFFIIPLLCAFASLVTHMNLACFHDGIRPIMPQIERGLMDRKEGKKRSYDLSTGFIASVGIPFTILTSLFNPWLLFLPTDILGVSSKNKIIAFLKGLLWGLIITLAFYILEVSKTYIKLDPRLYLPSIGPMIMGIIAILPLIIILDRYKLKKALISFVVTLFTSVVLDYYLSVPYQTSIFLVSFCILFVLIVNIEKREKDELDEDDMFMFEKQIEKVKKSTIYLVPIGVLLGVGASGGFIAGSEVSLFNLASDSTFTSMAELLRVFAFVPLLATTAMSTGIVSVGGYTLVFASTYFIPNIYIGGLVGGLVIILEAYTLEKLGKLLLIYPNLREVADVIRNNMNKVMELALLIISVFLSYKISGALGISILLFLYYINDICGKKILKIGIGPLALLVTTIIVNIIYYIN